MTISTPRFGRGGTAATGGGGGIRAATGKKTPNQRFGDDESGYDS